MLVEILKVQHIILNVVSIVLVCNEKVEHFWAHIISFVNFRKNLSNKNFIVFTLNFGVHYRLNKNVCRLNLHLLHLVAVVQRCKQCLQVWNHKRFVTQLLEIIFVDIYTSSKNFVNKTLVKLLILSIVLLFLFILSVHIV